MSDPPPAVPAAPPSRWWNVWLQGLVAAVVVYYLYRMAAHHWSDLDPGSLRLRWDRLVLSTSLGLAATLMMAGGWAWSLRLLHARLDGWTAIRIWILTGFLKYVPGKVWLLVARYLACQRRGVGRAVFLTSFVYEYFLLMAGGILACLATVPLWSQQGQANAYWWALPLMVATLAALHPRFFRPVTRWALVRLGREPLRHSFEWGRILELTFLFAGSWLVYGVGFVLLAQVFLPVGMDDVAVLIGVFALSFVLGQIVLISPGGLGVREWVIVSVLSLQFPQQTAAVTVLAVASRLWTVLVEVISLAPALLVPAREPEQADLMRR